MARKRFSPEQIITMLRKGGYFLNNQTRLPGLPEAGDIRADLLLLALCFQSHQAPPLNRKLDSRAVR